VPQGDLARSLEILEAAKDSIGFNRLIHEPGVAKISVVGVGMKSSYGVATRFFGALGDTPIRLVTTSEIKISCLLEDRYKEKAIKSLIAEFKL